MRLANSKNTAMQSVLERLRHSGGKVMPGKSIFAMLIWDKVCQEPVRVFEQMHDEHVLARGIIHEFTPTRGHEKGLGIRYEKTAKDNVLLTPLLFNEHQNRVVPIPYRSVNLTWKSFQKLCDDLQQKDAKFILEEDGEKRLRFKREDDVVILEWKGL